MVTMESVIGEIELPTSTAGHFDSEHLDLVVTPGGLGYFPGMKVEHIKLRVDRVVFPGGPGASVLAAGRQGQRRDRRRTLRVLRIGRWWSRRRIRCGSRAAPSCRPLPSATSTVAHNCR